MIILDTNVVLEPIRPFGSPAVQRWLDRQEAGTLYLTAISLAELLVGVEVLPDGRRKEGLANNLGGIVERLFGPRILAFDELSAVAYAKMEKGMRRSGQSLALGDALIAAIARRHAFTLATRDSALYSAAGVLVVDPWQDA